MSLLILSSTLRSLAISTVGLSGIKERPLIVEYSWVRSDEAWMTAVIELIDLQFVSQFPRLFRLRHLSQLEEKTYSSRIARLVTTSVLTNQPTVPRRLPPNEHLQRLPDALRPRLGRRPAAGVGSHRSSRILMFPRRTRRHATLAAPPARL